MTRLLYPLPDIIDPPNTICVKLRIPDERGHRMAFLGAIESLTKWFSWDRDEAKTGKDVALVWKQIYDDLEEFFGNQICEDTFPMLRQNPLEPCKMQYQDSMGNWVTFYDFGLCDLFGVNIEIGALLNYSETNVANGAIGQQVIIYNNDPNLYPPQTSVNQVQIDNRNTLLCYAMRVIVSSILETIARNKEDADRNTITLGMFVGAVLALGFAPLIPVVVGGILTGFTLGYVVAIQSVSEDELRDQNEIDKLLCHIYAQLEGDNLSRAALVASLASNPFNVGTPAYKMVEVLRPMFGVLQTYLAIITHMQANIASVQALINECLNCGNDVEWSHTFDFAVSQHATWWTPQPFNVTQMSYSAGNGWIGGINIPTSNLRFNVAYLRLVTTPQNTFIQNYDVYYDFVATALGDNIETRIQWLTQLDGVNSAITETDIPATSHTAVVNKSIERIVDRLLFQVVGGRRAGALPNGSLKITKVVINGKGYNPFI